MVSKKEVLGIGLLLLILAIGGYFFPKSSFLSSGSTGAISIEDYDGGYIRQNGGYTSAYPITLTGANGDLTVGGGSFSLTTSNSATSTISLGCVQTVATSTQTPIALTFSTIATTTTMSNGQTNNGFVMWKYGSCPF